MKGILIVIGILLHFALSACQNSGDMSSEESPSSEAWETLFAGDDLDSFNRIGDANWTIVDDYVEAVGGIGSFLVTKRDYSDFHLRVEFWTSPDANSGIFLRCQNSDEIAEESCYELNIYDQNPNVHNRTGAIVNRFPPMESIEAGNQWNAYDIAAVGPRIVVRLNDILVVDMVDENYSSGRIGLQNNGGLVRFRNVQVRPL